ncbi:ClpXP protease specificity-enhancing factor SspB [Phenylobacterium sp.]|uniref:ClpXP protease specificity-enhancing factor SspB n=1 Tax=Phenylobacterium sp. TaxID=1871053 RepID=UPI0037C7AD9A
MSGEGESNFQFESRSVPGGGEAPGDSAAGGVEGAKIEHHSALDGGLEILGTIAIPAVTLAFTVISNCHDLNVTFATDHPGVELSDAFQLKYPQSMRIVVGGSFWDLACSAEGFEVSLSFGGVKERLLVPYASIRVFADKPGPFHNDAQDADGNAP